MADDVWLVVGMGNPGPTYARTRHNIGHLVADELAARTGSSFKQHKQVKAEVIETRISGLRTVIAKPRSYMNESGGPVKALCDFYKIPIERLVVVHDELDIPYGTLRLKRGGGDNGHNGLRSITKSLGGRDYLRVRFGIGRPPGRMDAAAFVLRDFSGTERKELDLGVDRAADAVEALLTEGLDRAQNTFHAEV